MVCRDDIKRKRLRVLAIAGALAEAVLDGFGKVLQLDIFVQVEVRDGTRGFQDLVVIAAGETEFLRGFFEQIC